MAWIELHQSLREHKKVYACSEVLGVSRLEMIGMLISIWLWALDNAQDGALGGVSDRTIARVCDFPEKKAGKLVDALRTTGWLDEDKERNCLVIHDWHDYAGKLMERRKSDRERKERSRKPAGKPPEAPPDSGTYPPEVQRTGCGQNADVLGKSCATVPYRTVPIPTNSISEHNNQDCTMCTSAEGKAFTSFWEAYPSKADREDAWNAWRELNPDAQTVRNILAGLAAWKKSGQWQDDGGRFIPYAAKWLRNRRWECPPEPSTGGQTVPQGASGVLGPAELEAIQRTLREEYP